MMRDVRDKVIGIGLGLLWALPIMAIGAALAVCIFIGILKLFRLWG